MKQRLFVVFLCSLLLPNFVVAQETKTNDRELSINNIEEYYTKDTTRIHSDYRKAIEVAPSLVMRLKAINEAEEAYNNLVNEYFKLLFQNLNKEERILIMNDQRRWKQYVRVELKLYNTFAKPPYVQKSDNKEQYVYYAKRYLEQTRQRAKSLYLFLLAINRRNNQGLYKIEKECVSPLL